MMLTADLELGVRRLGAGHERGDANMTIRAILFGAMLALTPSLALVALLVWRRRIGLSDRRERRRLRTSPHLDLHDQPLYPNS
jgi:hypothetical protein